MTRPRPRDQDAWCLSQRDHLVRCPCMGERPAMYMYKVHGVRGRCVLGSDVSLKNSVSTESFARRIVWGEVNSKARQGFKVSSYRFDWPFNARNR